MAGQAQRVALADEHRGLGAVRVVAAEAGHTPPIHQALHVVVALHPVLVCGAVGKMREGGLAKMMLFELPVLAELITLMKTNRPIEIPALDWIAARLAL